MGRRDAARERGSVVVEFALTIPTVMVLVLGGVDLGTMIATRHQLTNATNTATRAAALTWTLSETVIQTKIEQLFPREKCADLDVDVKRMTGIAPAAPADGVEALEVTTSCTLAEKAFFSLSGGKKVTVVASMPLPPP